MKTYRIATLPGDDIGKKVVPASRELLEALAASSDAGTIDPERRYPSAA